jgi:hypothetical protein
MPGIAPDDFWPVDATQRPRLLNGRNGPAHGIGQPHTLVTRRQNRRKRPRPGEKEVAEDLRFNVAVHEVLIALPLMYTNPGMVASMRLSRLVRS